MGRRKLFTLGQVESKIRSFVSENGYFPNMRELADELGCVSTRTAHRYVRALVEKGTVVEVPARKWRLALRNVWRRDR